MTTKEHPSDTKPWLFKPGQSGNPSGRTKESLTKLLTDYLNENDSERKHKLVAELYQLAISTGQRGQLPAMTEIWNRIDGKVADKHLNLNVSTTPELLQQAQRQLLETQEAETKLLEEYK